MNKPFKVIIAGSRDFTDYRFLKSKLDVILLNKKNIEIVSGACNTGKLTYNRPDGTAVCGADGLGERYAAEKGYIVKHFPAQWTTFGKPAGYIRNKEMAQYCGKEGGCIIFRINNSRGSTNMAENAEEFHLKLKVFDIN